ncbi:unnamed protein product [Schistosoma curassoni]|uniref:ENTH domain-containing protein n=1 Tax=Schistosoma curassoni TaxID=6186 RepID=A0A183L109_9TREM|nr:unnamed protein product [Schistosoma curassoni]
MAEIADKTHNVMAFTEIMQMIWRRLNDKSKNWRHVYKALVLLEYLSKTGSDKVATQCRENIHSIETLRCETSSIGRSVRCFNVAASTSLAYSRALQSVPSTTSAALQPQ